MTEAEWRELIRKAAKSVSDRHFSELYGIPYGPDVVRSAKEQEQAERDRRDAELAQKLNVGPSEDEVRGFDSAVPGADKTYEYRFANGFASASWVYERVQRGSIFEAMKRAEEARRRAQEAFHVPWRQRSSETEWPYEVKGEFVQNRRAVFTEAGIAGWNAYLDEL